ncbi:CdaR family protein [Bizionia sp. KMM 8389]
MKLSNTYTNTIAFKIDKRNVPEDAVIYDDSLNELQISLKTTGFNLLKYYFNTPKVKVNFSENITKTETKFIWNKHSAFLDVLSQFDEHIEVVNITPDTLIFKYDVNAIKMVPIELNSDINYAIGYDVLDAFKLTPDSIKIIGPEVLVSAIDFIETDTLKLKGVKSDFSTSIGLKLPNANQELKFSNSQVQVEAQVAKFTEGKLKIPVTVVNIPEGINVKYYPKKINVSYYTSLANYNSISASDFEIICDFNELSKNQSFLIPRITKQPSVLRHVKLNQDQIEYIITE